MRPSRFAPATVLLIQVVENTGQRIGVDLEPPNAIVTPPPPKLTSRIATIRPRHRDREIVERKAADDVLHRFGVSDTREHMSRVGHARVKRPPRLADEST